MVCNACPQQASPSSTTWSSAPGQRPHTQQGTNSPHDQHVRSLPGHKANCYSIRLQERSSHNDKQSPRFLRHHHLQHQSPPTLLQHALACQGIPGHYCNNRTDTDLSHRRRPRNCILLTEPRHIRSKPCATPSWTPEANTRRAPRPPPATSQAPALTSLLSSLCQLSAQAGMLCQHH